MSPGDRCDEIIRLIDEGLDDGAAETAPDPDTIEARSGTWGVYYFRPPA
ncbi:MAG TPA: hypothetical protein VM618_07745 [Acidimicrobiia bacterium]|nr:hypothetical protein [Acidimicrobiia bacterium]